MERFALFDQNDEQCGGTEYDAHAGDQSKIYPLFGEWIVRRTRLFGGLLIQETCLSTDYTDLQKKICVICGLTFQFLQFVPCSFSFFAEEHNVVLPFVEVET